VSKHNDIDDGDDDDFIVANSVLLCSFFLTNSVPIFYPAVRCEKYNMSKICESTTIDQLGSQEHVDAFYAVGTIAKSRLHKYVQLKVAIAFAMYISGSCSFVVTIHNNMMFVCVRWACPPLSGEKTIIRLYFD